MPSRGAHPTPLSDSIEIPARIGGRCQDCSLNRGNEVPGSPTCGYGVPLGKCGRVMERRLGCLMREPSACMYRRFDRTIRQNVGCRLLCRTRCRYVSDICETPPARGVARSTCVAHIFASFPRLRVITAQNVVCTSGHLMYVVRVACHLKRGIADSGASGVMPPASDSDQYNQVTTPDHKRQNQCHCVVSISTKIFLIVFTNMLTLPV